MNVLAVKLTTHLASKNAKSTINSPVVNKVHATTNDQNSKGKLKMRELLLTTEDHKAQAIEPSLQDYHNDIKKQ